jgi:hypothetical protein
MGHLSQKKVLVGKIWPLLAPIFPPHHNGQAAGEQKGKDAQPHGHRGSVHGQFNMIEKAHKVQDSHNE